jgi:hypothetical protein
MLRIYKGFLSAKAKKDRPHFFVKGGLKINVKEVTFAVISTFHLALSSMKLGALSWCEKCLDVLIEEISPITIEVGLQAASQPLHQIEVLKKDTPGHTYI